MKQHEKNLVHAIEKFLQRHAKWQVFTDWVQMMALAISNAVDWRQYKEREASYLEIVKKYNKEELDKLCEMMGMLVLALEEEVAGGGPGDVLGPVFHSLELHNKWHGQFFTPKTVCDMMARISIDRDDKGIREQGYVSVCEPCAGAGAMVLAFAKAMKECGHNYCENMVATCVDIDPKCVHMTYVQLALCGIPAVVIHGHTLTVEEWSRWYTPAYILGGWIRRQHCGMTEVAEAITKQDNKPIGMGYTFFFDERSENDVRQSNG